MNERKTRTQLRRESKAGSNRIMKRSIDSWKKSQERLRRHYGIKKK